DFIDFKDYIISLLNEISFVHQSEKEVVKVIKVENIFFDVETAIPLGLIINEIITNTYKYAFKDKKNEINKILIEIEKQKDASYKLIIEDNGVGIPKDFNIETSKSIGLKLVKRLIKQLHGSFLLIRNPSTRFELTFKDSSIRNQIE
ncbi:MAG: sensor histidine kinase, partial [Flavobacteriales bacterium]